MLKKAGGLHVDNKPCIPMQCTEVAREHKANLVGKNLMSFIVDNAAAVSIPVEPKPTSAPLANTAAAMSCSMCMSSGFGL